MYNVNLMHITCANTFALLHRPYTNVLHYEIEYTGSKVFQRWRVSGSNVRLSHLLAITYCGV